MHYSEIELVSEMQTRNTDAFDQLIKEYTSPISYLVYNILNIGTSNEDIEECVSDVFAEAWEKIDRFDPKKGTLRTWLLMLAKYRALTYKRKLSRHSVDYLEDYTKDQLADASASMADIDTQQLIIQIVNSFNDIDRELFVRRYFFDEPISSLMKSMDVSDSAVNNRLLRCRNKIKEALSCG